MAKANTCFSFANLCSEISYKLAFLQFIKSNSPHIPFPNGTTGTVIEGLVQ